METARAAGAGWPRGGMRGRPRRRRCLRLQRAAPELSRFSDREVCRQPKVGVGRGRKHRWARRERWRWRGSARQGRPGEIEGAEVASEKAPYWREREGSADRGRPSRRWAAGRPRRSGVRAAFSGLFRPAAVAGGEAQAGREEDGAGRRGQKERGEAFAKRGGEARRDGSAWRGLGACRRSIRRRKGRAPRGWLAWGPRKGQPGGGR